MLDEGVPGLNRNILPLQVRHNEVLSPKTTDVLTRGVDRYQGATQHAKRSVLCLPELQA